MPQFERIGLSEVRYTAKRGRRRAETSGNGKPNGAGDLGFECLRALPILRPPLPVQEAFDQAFPLRTRTSLNQRESGTLAAIRDALPPKLLSGEIRVRDAEKLVEATV